MFLGLLGYLLTGFVAVMGSILIHFARAESKGYKAVDFWNDDERVEAFEIVITDGIVQTTKDKVRNTMIKVFLWPYMLVKLITIYYPMLYGWYELK